MGSLKDALKKAGFQPARVEKPENRRPKRQAIKKEKIHTHQEHRNFCESCNRTTPDVECYEHTNRLVDAKWLCVRCADDNSIPDEYRTSNQSEYSRKKIFRREYGRTKRFFPNPAKKDKDTNSGMRDTQKDPKRDVRKDSRKGHDTPQKRGEVRSDRKGPAAAKK